jgi:hypothetical protein
MLRLYAKVSEPDAGTYKLREVYFYCGKEENQLDATIMVYW